MSERSNQMFIETKFRPGDKVKWGPHDAIVQILSISYAGITYNVSYWLDDCQEMGSAFAFELELVEPVEV